MSEPNRTFILQRGKVNSERFDVDFPAPMMASQIKALGVERATIADRESAGKLSTVLNLGEDFSLFQGECAVKHPCQDDAAYYWYRNAHQGSDQEVFRKARIFQFREAGDRLARQDHSNHRGRLARDRSDDQESFDPNLCTFWRS